jgi:hypothetical protein
MIIAIWLVVEPPTPLKNDGVKVTWDGWKFPTFHGKKTCSKAPTSYSNGKSHWKKFPTQPGEINQCRRRQMVNL